MSLVTDSLTATSQLRGGGRRRAGRADSAPRRSVGSRVVGAGFVVIVLGLALLALSRLFGYSTLVVLSGSMSKTAPVGSLVLARPMDTRDVRVGDVILIRRGGVNPPAPILHRVISLTRSAGEIVATTKGDSNAVPDPRPYVLSGTTTTPVLAVPHLGRAYALLRTRLGWMLLIAVPATTLLWVELRKIWVPTRRRSHTAPNDHDEPAP